MARLIKLMSDDEFDNYLKKRDFDDYICTGENGELLTPEEESRFIEEIDKALFVAIK